MNQLKLLGVSFILFPIIDYIWLAKVMSDFYLKELGSLARVRDGVFAPVLWPAVVVYICLAIGVVFFALPKVNSDSRIWEVFGWGALLGLSIYGVYDMTNLSLVENWSLKMSVVDIAWGGFLCGVVTVAARTVRDLGN